MRRWATGDFALVVPEGGLESVDRGGLTEEAGPLPVVNGPAAVADPLGLVSQGLQAGGLGLGLLGGRDGVRGDRVDSHSATGADGWAWRPTAEILPYPVFAAKPSDPSRMVFTRQRPATTSNPSGSSTKTNSLYLLLADASRREAS